jgi:hypothetical protein
VVSPSPSDRTVSAAFHIAKLFWRNVGVSEVKMSLLPLRESASAVYVLSMLYNYLQSQSIIK